MHDASGAVVSKAGGQPAVIGGDPEELLTHLANSTAVKKKGPSDSTRPRIQPCLLFAT